MDINAVYEKNDVSNFNSSKPNNFSNRGLNKEAKRVIVV